MITINEEKRIQFKNNEARKMREYLYSTESDALFMKWQRGEIEKQVWLDKVQEIRSRYPYET